MVEIWSVIFDSERVKIDFSIYSFRPLVKYHENSRIFVEFFQDKNGASKVYEYKYE